MDRRPLRVACFVAHAQSPSTRYRVLGYLSRLRWHGIACRVYPFADAALQSTLYRPGHLLEKIVRFLLASLRSVYHFLAALRSDVVWIQREACFVGPPVLEWLLSRIKPMVYDFDDALYTLDTAHREASRTYRWLKCPGKVALLAQWSRLTLVSNDYLANYARRHARRVEILSSPVDCGVYRPRAQQPPRRIPVLGWIGTHSTLPYLEALLPLLAQLRVRHTFRMRVICSVPPKEHPGIAVEYVPWAAEREPIQIRQFDIGLMPLADDEWTRGKIGQKLLLYLASGVPAVASPAGVDARVIHHGRECLFAKTAGDWSAALSLLLRRPSVRQRLARAGRLAAEKHYNIVSHASRLAEYLRQAAVQ